MIERGGFSATDEADSMIAVVETKRHHCGAMARRVRKVHRDILASGGIAGDDVQSVVVSSIGVF